MSRNWVMGLDVGSTGVKAALFDRALSEPVASATVHYVAHQTSDGVSEHGGDLLLNSSVQAMRALHDQMQAQGQPQPGDQLAAVAVCAMISGVIPVDGAGQALAPYTTTLDRRADTWLAAAIDAHGEQIFRLTGSAQPVMAAKTAWLREHLGAKFSQVAKILPAGPYVAGQLAGLDASAAFIDPTYLWMTGLADARRNAWSPDLCALLNVDSALLPTIRDSTEVVGHLDARIAQATGWRTGTPVVAGCGDQLAGYLGAGQNHPGAGADVAGTYSVFAIAAEVFAPAVAQRFECVRAAVPGLWHTQSLVAGGGLNSGWFCASVLAGHGIEEGAIDATLAATVEQAAAQLAPGADGVLFVPHLGGQALPLVPALRGAWLGLHWQHRREHLFRALLESIAFEHRLSWQERAAQPGFVAPTEVVSYGGGAASDLWCQIKADVLGVPVRRLAIADPAARGCALLAAAGAGWIDDIARAATLPYDAALVSHPDAQAHAAYAQVVKRYEKMVRALGELG